MDYLLYENISDLNNIKAELESQYIYESIIIESENTGKKNGKSLSEKLKSIWKSICNFIKKLIVHIKRYLRNVYRRIQEAIALAVLNLETVGDSSYRFNGISNAS